ncbi:MAG: MarR family transcriptional regulator [Cyanobacteria bacterium P01_H01_bin.105]
MLQLSKTQRDRQASFGFLLQLLTRRMDSRMKQKLAEIDIDLKIFANLRMLSDKDGINQRELGRLMEFPEYHTSRNVDALVKAGFVERRPDPNSRRSVLIFLTSKGREKAKQLPKLISEVNNDFLEVLADEERQQLIHLLKKVAKIPKDGDLAL